MKRSKLFNCVFDLIELNIPMAAFIALFVSYIIIIAFRYILLVSIAWLTEINTFLYLWCVVLAASYGTRTETHITFPVLYDRCSEKTKLVLRVVGNLTVLVMFVLLLPQAYKSIAAKIIRESSILKITYNIVYFPFIVFILLTIVHNSKLIVKDIKQALNLYKGKSGV